MVVATEFGTVVSGKESMVSELDGSNDFLDNDRLQELFSSELNFDEWTLLISEIENSFPDDIEKLCLVYNAFLLEFPLCHGYWRKYAYHKIRLCTLEDAVEVFERAVEAATYCVAVWVDYCAFAVAAYEDLHEVSRLFERGLSFVGKDYFCFTLWDKYIEFRLGQQQWSSLAHIYLRRLRFPSKKLHLYYKNFRKMAASLKEKIECMIGVNEDLSSDPMVEDVVPKRCTDDEISNVLRNMMGPSSSAAMTKSLHAYLSFGEQFYQDSKQLMEKISCFEIHIRRSYFHVKPLDTNQLENWHAYLSFVEAYGDFDWTIKLYERCLIPCANYTEFWFRYVDFVESKGGRELANFALARASQTFLKNASAIHLFNARYKEQVGDAFAASAALSQCDEELGFSFVENVSKKANMEKRLGNFEAATNTYKEALKKVVGKENSETAALLYVNFSRLKYMITKSSDEAAQILIEGNEKVPHCKLLLEELIRLLMMHGGSEQVDLLDPIIAKEISHQTESSNGLSAEEKEEISNLYMEFIDLAGTIHDVRKALGRHIKLFPHSARAKSHRPCPSRNSVIELIQRRQKTQELSTDNSFRDQVKSVVRSDYMDSEPNLESLASGENVAEKKNLCESDHTFATEQAQFSSNLVDTVKSDAIEIQPRSPWPSQTHQNQESVKQTGQNSYHIRDANHSKPGFHERPSQMSVLGQSSISQNPQKQYEDSTSQPQPLVHTSIAYPQTGIPLSTMQTNEHQEGQMQSDEAYYQMWQQHYYSNYYYHQQQQQLLTDQSQSNQHPQLQLDQQSQYLPPQQLEQFNTLQQIQEPQTQQHIEFQQHQRWLQQPQQWSQQEQQHLLHQQQESEGDDEQRLSTQQISTGDSDIHEDQECKVASESGESADGVASKDDEPELSSDTSISSI